MSIIQLTSALIINVGVQSVIELSDPIRLLFEKFDLDKEKMEPPKPVSTAADIENRTFKFGSQTEFVEVETMPPDNDRVWVRFKQYGESSESIVEFVSNHLKSWNCELDEKNEAFELKTLKQADTHEVKRLS